MNLLRYSGFLRNQNGLNNLPSIRELRNILNRPDDFIVDLKIDDIERFAQSGKI